MNRDGLVVQTDIDYQMREDDRMVIVHDPEFVRVPDTVLTSGVSTPAPVSLLPPVLPAQSLGPGQSFFDLEAPFTVPTPPAGFFYQASFTYSVNGGKGSTVPAGRAVVTETFQVFAGVLTPRSGRPIVVTNGVPFGNATVFAPVKIEPGGYRAFLQVNADLFDGQPMVNVSASIGIKLTLVQAVPFLKIALAPDPHRGDQISIIATNTSVNVYGPLTRDHASPLLAGLVPGQRLEGVFTGVEDQSLSLQWELAVLGGVNGATGPTGGTGDTVVGPPGPQGPTGPTEGPADQAYISAFQRTDELVAGGADVTFSSLGPRHNFSFLPGLIIADKSGTYRFDYYINGYPTTGDPTAMEFAIFKNGVEVPQSHYGSSLTVTPDSVSIHATGLITLVGGDSSIGNGDHLTLRNVTSGSIQPVQLVSPNPGFALAASISFERFAD